jgi:hypothetical protein
MTFIDNEAELMNEHLYQKEIEDLAKKAKEEAERVASNEEWRAKQRAKAVALWNKITRPLFNQIAYAIEGVKSSSGECHRAIIDDENMKFHVSGYDTQWILSINEIYEGHSSWSKKPTGRYRLRLGDYGDDRKSFSQKRDMSWNIKGIVEHLAFLVDKRLRQEAARRQTRDNEAAASRIRVAHGLHEWGSVAASSEPGKPVRIKFDFCRAMTEAQADWLIRQLKELGVPLN